MSFVFYKRKRTRLRRTRTVLPFPKNFHVLHVRGDMLVTMGNFDHPVSINGHERIIKISRFFALVIKNYSQGIPFLEGVPIAHEALP